MDKLPNWSLAIIGAAAVAAVTAVAIPLHGRLKPSDTNGTPPQTEMDPDNASAGEAKAGTAPAPLTPQRPQEIDHSNESSFKGEMQPYYEIIGEANLARICQLRSESWFEAILYAYQLAQIKLGSKYGISVDAVNAAAKQSDIEFESRHSVPDACGRLLHSPTLFQLDAYAKGGFTSDHQ
jgi:hypothetical protein